jgi:hypothetical protein
MTAKEPAANRPARNSFFNFPLRLHGRIIAAIAVL